MADEEYDGGDDGGALVEDETHVDDSQLKLADFDWSKFEQTKINTEEHETVVYEQNCKVYWKEGQEWRERGAGSLKLLKHKETGAVRAVLRQDKIGKVRINQIVAEDADLRPVAGSDKHLTWAALDASDEPVMKTHLIKLKDKAVTEEFKKHWDESRAANKAVRAARGSLAAPGGAAAPAAAGGAGGAGAAAAPAPAAAVDTSGPIPVADNLEAIYGAEKAVEAGTRVGALAEAFRAAYGVEPTFYVRAPGRVNLIGEHIDYHGYSVLPMALQTQDVIIAVAVTGGGSVRVSNVNAKYGSAELPLSPDAPVDQSQGVHWHQYVQCGYKGAFDFIRTKAKTAGGAGVSVPEPSGIAMMIDGRVPAGAGVSSSSALVVSSLLAVARANGIDKHMSRAELGEAGRVCELYIGTMSGGMDQAISSMGNAGAASLIDFEPLKATPVALPHDAAFVVSNTLEESAKAVDAEKRYNKRVTEGKLAAKLVAKGEGVASWATITTFRHLQETMKLPTPGALLPAIERHLQPGAYTLAKLAEPASFGQPVAGLFEGDNKKTGALKVINSVAADEPAFELLKRARHVCSEAERVYQLKAACEGKGVSGGEDAQLKRMGQLLTESHVSCRDDYECSSPGLDALTTLALQHGAYGSRLTGAGWGGCAVSLVHKSKVESFMAAIAASYYGAKGLSAQVPVALFASAPGSGAAVYTPAETFDI